MKVGFKGIKIIKVCFRDATFFFSPPFISPDRVIIYDSFLLVLFDRYS